jgi:hypothetical protein
MDAARSIPGVSAVGIVSHTPFTGGMHGVPIFRPGTTDFKLNNAALAPYVFQMSPGYLAAANTSLLSGRDVSWQDTPSTPYVAVVNHTFAQKMWGDSPAIGQHFILSVHITEVVGVVEDGKYHDLEESPQPVAGCAQGACDERCGGPSHVPALRGICPGSVDRTLRKPPAGTDCVSGQSSRSLGRRWCSGDYGAARHCSLGHPSPTRARRRSIQTHA